ncbi:olfactory receptor 2T8 [Camelus ferus]|nr:olfactory receptor 2T8 [Camelus ferus]
MGNWNTTSDFILLGLFNHTGAHLFLFVMVLMMAFTSLVGNALILVLILLDPRLHRPMYFLLSQLSLMDLLLVCTIVPKMAADYLTDRKSISPAGCGLQIFFFLTLGGADGLMQAAATLSFSFCSAREMDHFFCEAPTLVRLACADTSAFEYVMYICCVLMLLVPLSLILTSYGLILAAVLQMRSNEARKKAFATCSSHLSVVGLFFGAAIFTYMRPKSYRSANHDKVVSVYYTVFTPVLNPLIYSLRNSEVKGALRKCMDQCAALSICPKVRSCKK